MSLWLKRGLYFTSSLIFLSPKTFGTVRDRKSTKETCRRQTAGDLLRPCWLALGTPRPDLPANANRPRPHCILGAGCGESRGRGSGEGGELDLEMETDTKAPASWGCGALGRRRRRERASHHPFPPRRRARIAPSLLAATLGVRTA